MSISIAISIYNLAPIFVLILGALLLKEKMTIQALVATVTCFIGSIFIIGLQNFISLSEFMQSGFVWALLSALFYAFTMLTSRTIKNLSAYALTFIQTAVGIVMLVPFVDFSLFEGLTTTNWLYILGTGFIHTGFVYYLFFDSIRSLSTILVSVLVFVDPVVAILLDMLLLDFMPSAIQTLGILLIFSGIFILFIFQSKKLLCRNEDLIGQGGIVCENCMQLVNS